MMWVGLVPVKRRHESQNGEFALQHLYVKLTIRACESAKNKRCPRDSKPRVLPNGGSDPRPVDVGAFARNCLNKVIAEYAEQRHGYP